MAALLLLLVLLAAGATAATAESPTPAVAVGQGFGPARFGSRSAAGRDLPGLSAVEGGPAFDAAQEKAAGQQNASPAAPPPSPSVSIPVVSLARIRRQLGETPPRDPSSSPLTLEYHIDVVGTAPKIDFFKDFTLHPGSGVQYGGMTHREFLQIVAPPWRKW